MTAGPAGDSLAPMATLLEAITQRDHSALAACLTAEVEPRISYYWGEEVTGRDAIAAWHREWFEEDGWIIGELLLRDGWESGSLAALCYELPYDKGPDRRFRYLLAVTALRETDGAWRIARVQYTQLEGPRD